MSTRRFVNGLVWVWLASLLTGCSATAVVVSPQPSLSALPSTAGNISPADVNLKVYARPANQGVHCPVWPDRTSHLVLAGNRLSFSGDEVNQLATFARGMTDPTAATHPEVPRGLLRGVSGVLTSGASPLPPGVTGFDFHQTCAFQFELTNLGSDPIQVSKAGVRLRQAPELNGASYRLIEMCSVAASTYYCGPQLGAGPGTCGYYAVSVGLQRAGAGAVFEETPAVTGYLGEPQPDLQCPELTIPPSATVDLRIDLWSADRLIYEVEAVLTVETSAGQRVVPLSDQGGTAAFAGPDQFTCYKLDGNTFVPFAQGADALDFHKVASAGGWCL